MSPPLPDAPCVAVSAETDRRVREVLEALVEALREGFGSSLVAVVLGGSLARGEGVVLDGGSEGLRLLSDLDVYAVRRPPGPPGERLILAQLRAAVQQDPWLEAPLDLGAVDPGFFGRLGDSLPAHQLARGARVLWQAPGRTSDWVAPKDGLRPGRTVDAEDAALLALNRCAESLLLRGSGAQSAFAQFHRWKLWLDAPLAWLAAEDRYVPGRDEQLSSLRKLGETWEDQEGARLVVGAEHGLRLYREMTSSPIGGESLRRLGIREHHALPGDPALALRDWVWPFVRALIFPRHSGTASERLHESFALEVPDSTDAARFASWLRRQGVAARLRRARRWAGHAPRGLTPWWRHGWGGVGPDRLRAACALRWAGAEGWEQMLTKLLPEGMPGPDAPHEGADVDRWLGGLWSAWIMEGARQ